jgi:FYVE/RhoGEF/PH domain-containing protein 5/6
VPFILSFRRVSSLPKPIRHITDVILVTNTLNTSLHTHSQTLALLALQRTTANLPFQLISPGRNLVKRSALFQAEGASDPKEREFLLFTDCILWLVAADNIDGQRDEKWQWQARESNTSLAAVRPGMFRQRSKSDASLPTLQSTRSLAQAARISEGGSPTAPGKSMLPKAKKKQRAATGGAEEKWVFKGRAELVDTEVIPSSFREPGDERKFEVLNPEASFVVYASELAWA